MAKKTKNKNKTKTFKHAFIHRWFNKDCLNLKTYRLATLQLDHPSIGSAVGVNQQKKTKEWLIFYFFYFFFLLLHFRQARIANLVALLVTLLPGSVGLSLYSWSTLSKAFLASTPTSSPLIFSCLQYCLINSRLLRLSCTYLRGM